MKDKLGLESKLSVGSSGIFEVAVDGIVVANRHNFMFPSEDEIVAAVKARLSPAGGSP